MYYSYWSNPFIRNFTDALLNNCLNINESGSNWSIKSNVATGQLKNQIVTVKPSDADKRGSLPSKIEGNINYYTFSSSTSVSVARFLVSFTCQDGSFESDNCRCEGN